MSSGLRPLESRSILSLPTRIPHAQHRGLVTARNESSYLSSLAIALWGSGSKSAIFYSKDTRSLLFQSVTRDQIACWDRFDVGVRARHGQNLTVSGFGGYDHGVHRVGWDAPWWQEAGDSGSREGGARGNGNRSR